MKIIPSVDIKSGRAVRLYQGDFAKETVVGENPVAIVNNFLNLGAEEVHIVNLDGALGDKSANMGIIKDICKSKTSQRQKIQLGGGIRNLEDIETALELGIDSVVIGSMIAEDFELFAKAVEIYKDKIVAALDVKDEALMTRGWLDGSAALVYDITSKIENLNVRRIVLTDITKDGTLLGPNINLALELSKIYSGEIIVSGGVADYEDLESIKDNKLAGAILGKSIYCGRIDLEKAFELGGNYGI